MRGGQGRSKERAFLTTALSLCMDMEAGLRYLLLGGIAIKLVLLSGMLVGWVRQLRKRR